MSLVYAPTMSPGEALAHLREARSWTQGQLAKLSGVHRNTIGQFERGVFTRPTAKSIGGFARAFGVTVAQMEHDLGLAPFGAQRLETPASMQELKGQSMYGQRAERLIHMFLNLSPSQQDYLESVALNLHSTRHASDPKDAKGR